MRLLVLDNSQEYVLMPCEVWGMVNNMFIKSP